MLVEVAISEIFNNVFFSVSPADNARDERLPSACSATQATCMNGECIDKSQICDGIPHCSDGSDEHSCSQGRKCQPNQFMCRNSKCVDRVWRCDGENDCGDNSDEESCDPEPSGAPCRYDEFQCRSGHCIPKSFQCDDTNDCRDGSDEIGCSKFLVVCSTCSRQQKLISYIFFLNSSGSRQDP